MATRKSSNYFWKHSHLHDEDYLNSDLSKSAQKAFDAVIACSNPCYDVSWTDLYAIFRNSRQLAREANELDPSVDRELQAAIGIMQEDHGCLRRVLFLVAIEKLFDCGHQNAMKVLSIYVEQLACADQISERLAETEEEIALVQARLEAVFV
jgi:hypothetical protein